MIWQEASIALESVHRLSNLLISIIVITSILTLFIGYSAEKMVSDPILSITETMHSFSNRNYPEIPYQERGDEMGKMAKALGIFKSNALDKARLEEEKKLEKIRQEHERKETVRNLAQAFEKRIQSTIQTVASASTELATTTNDGIHT